jgi:hypothetical protein
LGIRNLTAVAVRLAFERLQSEGTADPIGVAAR